MDTNVKIETAPAVEQVPVTSTSSEVVSGTEKDLTARRDENAEAVAKTAVPELVILSNGVIERKDVAIANAENERP